VAAKKRLAAMDTETVAAIKSKQAARLVLARQAQLAKSMAQEGLLTTQHAEEFLSEISEDTQRIEHERNRMYRQQTEKKGKEMQADKEGRDSQSRFPFSGYMSPRPSEKPGKHTGSLSVSSLHGEDGMSSALHI
jgi:hypothetical protein